MRKVVARFRIVGTDLPGATCHPAPERSDGYKQIHVGVQRGREVVDLVPGEASEAVFEFDVDVRRGQLGGPFIHGRDGQRFIYLSWGELVDGEFRMFRRAKLHVDHIDSASADGGVVEATLSLSDERGNPLCASVRPPNITWAVSATH
jgi:hypothetical protein